MNLLILLPASALVLCSSPGVAIFDRGAPPRATRSAAFWPLAVGNVLLGVGFGLLQGVCGVVIVRRYGG